MVGECLTTLQNSRTKVTAQKKPHGPVLSNDALELLKRDFPHFCRKFRVAKGLSAAKLAHMLGIGEPDNSNTRGKIAISRWEAGTHVPHRRYLEKFMTLQNEYDASNIGRKTRKEAK